MKNNKEMRRQARRRAQRRRVLTTVLLMALVAVCAIGGTLAWLTDQTEAVQNTFTTSDINITLTESKEDFQMIPGHTIDKDPMAGVKAGSEDAFLFVKLEKSENYSTYLAEYEMAEGWTKLDGFDGVYYRTVAASETDQTFPVLKDNKVTVLETVTKAQMEDAKTTAPTLTITAYACQQYKTNGTEFTAAEAWANVKPTTAA